MALTHLSQWETTGQLWHLTARLRLKFPRVVWSPGRHVAPSLNRCLLRYKNIAYVIL